MKVIKNYFWNTGYQIFVLLVPFITTPYISATLGPKGVGINAYTNSITQYFILAGSMGIAMYGNRQVAYERDNRKNLSSTFWELVSLRIILTSIATIFYIVFLLLVGQYQFFFVVQGIAIVASVVDISWFFQGLEKFRITVTRNFIVKVLSIVCIFTFVKNSGDTALYISILTGSILIGNVTLWPYLRSLVDLPQSLHLRKHIKPMVVLFVPQIAMQLYLQLNKTMLGAMVGVTAAGYFDSSDKVIRLILAAVTSIGTVMLPHVANSFKNNDTKKVNDALDFSLHFTLLLAIPCMFGIAAIAPRFTLAFFGNRFMAVSGLMRMESLIVLAVGISGVIGYQYLLPTNQLKIYSRSIIIGSLLNIIINAPLILMIGAMGAMASTVISEIFVTAYQLVKIRTQMKISRLFIEIWEYFVAGLVMFIALFSLQKFAPSGWLGIFVLIVLGFIVYTIVIVLLRPRHLWQQFKIFRS